MLSGAVGRTGGEVGSGAHRPPESRKLLNQLRDFSDVLSKALERGGVQWAPGRPTGGDHSKSLSERAAGVESIDPVAAGPGDRSAAGDEQNQKVEAITDWQPGAMDPLAFLTFGASSTSSAARAKEPMAALEPLVSELLKSIAWGGDRRRGTVRIELGAGRYAGATLQVDAVGDGLRIDVEAPAGVDGAALGARLAERFEARGLRVDRLLVR